jgi:hypothetical protein
MGFFDKIFQKRKSENTSNSAGRALTHEGSLGGIIRFNLHCKRCGREFEVGKDAIIYSDVVPADGALQPMKYPDMIISIPWSQMSESAREAQRRIYGAIIASLMLSKMSGKEWLRMWKCPSCHGENLWQDDLDFSYVRNKSDYNPYSVDMSGYYKI